MKKVFQTIIDKGKGNCMQAALASLFDLPLDEVPHCREKEEWFECIWKFVQSIGYDYHGCINNQKHSQTGKHLFDRIGEDEGVDGLFFATVYSPAYYDPKDKVKTTHAVVIDKKFNIVHDPNPNYAGNKEYPLADELGYNGIKSYWIIEKII